MIVELVLDVVISILSFLLGLLPALPSFPSAITDIWAEFMTYLQQGMSFIGHWIYLPVALPCVGIIVAIELWDDFYKMLRFFINKIPFLNIRL